MKTASPNFPPGLQNDHLTFPDVSNLAKTRDHLICVTVLEVEYKVYLVYCLHGQSSQLYRPIGCG